MEYPKPVMSKKELLGMGFTRAYLDRAIASPGKRIQQISTVRLCLTRRSLTSGVAKRLQ